jgi:hypothetical protein
VKRLALVLVLVAAALPAAAPGAGCSPLDCAPSGTPIPGTSLLGVRAFGSQGPLRAVDLRDGRTRFRLPTGVPAGRRYIARVPGERELAWYDIATGHRVAGARVANGWSLVGASVDGGRAVLERVANHPRAFGIMRANGTVRQVVLPRGSWRFGSWSFDALAGSRLYLLQSLRNGYAVRLYDLARSRLVAQPLKDAHESALIRGSAWERAASPDGRYLFTLYVGQNGGAMVHELDLRAATARCIDLPGIGDFNAATSYALLPSADGTTLWAISTGFGKVAAIDVATARVRGSFGFAAATGNAPISSAAALSPDGRQIAVALAGKIWFVDLAAQRIVRQRPHVAIAIGYSPDGKTLWGVGERSRVFAMRAY